MLERKGGGGGGVAKSVRGDDKEAWDTGRIRVWGKELWTQAL